MARYRGAAYLIEMLAAFAVCLTLLLPWHQDYGRGSEVLQQALEQVVPFGLDPFNPGSLPVSQWWLIWIVPLVAIVLALRACVGWFFLNLPNEHNRWVMGFILLWMGIAFAWFGMSYERGVQIGYWLCGVATGVQILTVMIEMFLPEKTFMENVIDDLPPDHPARLLTGRYRSCPVCGAPNKPEARHCHSCNFRLLPQIQELPSPRDKS